MTTEPTILYRENPDAYDTYPGLPDVFRHLIKFGALVPAEPNIEAFAKWMYTFLSPPGVIAWSHLNQQRREDFMDAMRTAITEIAYGVPKGDNNE